jgi:ribose/xylose/arabinose/galactoside ABC-type transport system permease subunit
LVWLLLLVALAAALEPFLRIDWPGLFGAPANSHDPFRQGRAYDELLSGITRKMASFYLPMALGWLLCLRCGAIDLSVWVVSSLSGVVAARCILAQAPPWEGMALGVLAGAAVGALNGLLTAFARIPSLIATFLTGMALLFAMQYTQPARQVVVPDRTFDRWHLPVPTVAAGLSSPSTQGGSPTEVPPAEEESQPLFVTQMLLALAAYSLVMIVLLAMDWFRPRAWGPGSRRKLWLSMVASGALAAVGGGLWLLDHGKAPVSTRLVDDFTVPVAALLAGGAFLAGRGRTLLAAVFLPGALLLTNLWRQEVWLFQWHAYPLQVALLGCLVLLVHAAGSDFTAGTRAYRAGPLASGLLAVAGIVLLAEGAAVRPGTGRWIQAAGLAIWALAAGVLLVSRVRRRKNQTA